MLRINPNYDPELYDRCDEFVSYHKEQISKSINEYLLKQLNDMWVQHNIRPENLSLNDTIEFDRYVIPSYVSIDYKDKNASLIPIVL